MSRVYSISELAAEFDVTTRTIRFYEEKQLLHPQRQGQNRLFSAADRTRLKLILRGKRLGFTLEESSEIVNMYDPAQGNVKQIRTLLDKITSKREQLLQQQQDIEMMLNDLRGAEEKCIEGTIIANITHRL